MKTILIIEYFRFGREYLLRSKRLGLRTVLATQKDAEDIKEEDRKNIDHLIRITKESDKDIALQIIENCMQEKIDGVLAGHVGLVPLAAMIADMLELPSFGTNAAYECAYKNLSRKRMEKEGFFKHSYYEINSIQDILNIHEELKYPLIIKPIDGFSSINVQKVDNYNELLLAYSKHTENRKYLPLSKEFSETVLIESYFTGKEYSVESIVENGTVHIITITDKQKDPDAPFVESGHIIPAFTLTNNQEDKVKEFVRKMHKIFNVQNGLTHTEVIVNHNEIDLIEINPRLGGGYIGEVLGKAFNIDMYEIAVKNALGMKNYIPETPVCCAFVGFAIAKKTGKLLAIGGIEKVKNQPNIEWVKKCHSIFNEISSTVDNRARICAFLGSTTLNDKKIFEKMENIAQLIEVSIE
nr:ATP-grasp domain-containing protein [uncultured Aminipila sp.]